LTLVYKKETMPHLKFFAVVLIILTAHNLKGQQPIKSTASFFVDSLAKDALKNGPVAGICIGIKQKNKILVEKAYGYANIELKVPTTIHTVYLLQSISKMFTAISIMQLAEESKLSIDDEIGKWIEELDSIKKHITIRQLLSHTSGIKNYGGETWRKNYKNLAMLPQQWIDLQTKEPLDFPPGTNYSYSNTGFDILSLIVEKASGEKFSGYVKNHIAKPAGLTETGHYPVQTIVSGHASPYEVIHDTLFRADEWGNYGYGATHIHSTIDDLLKFSDALNKNILISRVSLQQMRTPLTIAGQISPYGFGTRIVLFPGHTGYGHTGSGGGWTTDLHYFPGDDLTVTVLFNTENDNDPNFPMASEIARKIEKKFFGFSEMVVKDIAVPKEDINKYTGNWLTPSISIYEKNGQLWAVIKGFSDSTRLLYQGDNRFTPDADHLVVLEFQMHNDKTDIMKVYRDYALVGFSKRKE
jgi:CubicO group peptidase (beta-lactamase class C family)